MIFSQEQARQVFLSLEAAAQVDADVRLTGSAYQLNFCPAIGHISIEQSAPAISLLGRAGNLVATAGPLRIRERYDSLKEFADSYGIRTLPGYPEIFGRES